MKLMRDGQENFKRPSNPQYHRTPGPNVAASSSEARPSAALQRVLTACHAGALRPADVSLLQQRLGNQAVQRQLADHTSSMPRPVSGEDDERYPVQRSAASRPAVIQRNGGAGHKDAWSFSKDKRHVIKVTSDAEADVYANANALGIAGVIPGHIEQLRSYSEIDRYEPVRKLREPTAGEKIIVIENLAQKRSKLDFPPIILDAKIGFYTASATQAEKEGVTAPKIKALRHFVIDTVMYDSREKGYRFEDGQQWIDQAKTYSRTGKATDITPTWLTPIDLATAFHGILTDLLAIKGQMVTANVTFVGSSVLLIISPTHPQDSKAKMIDFAHPIEKSKVEPDYFEKYRSNYTQGIESLIRDLAEIHDALLNVRYVSDLELAGTARQLHDVL